MSDQQQQKQQQPPKKRRRCCGCNFTLCRICLYLCLTTTLLTIAITLFISHAVVFHIMLPARRAFHLETAYLDAHQRADFTDSIDAAIFSGMQARNAADGTNHSVPGPYARPRVQRLVQDVKQLQYWQVGINMDPVDAAFGGTWTETWWESLGLWPDGTGDVGSKVNEFWVYVGGSSPDDVKGKMREKGDGDKKEKEEEDDDPTIFKHPYRQHTCINDPKYICDSYNEAFNRISERWHGTTGSLTLSPPSSSSIPSPSKAQLRFIDCDTSPFFCDSFFFGLFVDPVMLLHVKIEEECVFTMRAGLKRCPVTWRFVGLPIPNAPFTRQIRIPLDDKTKGSVVVPAFPSAEEQLWTLMAHQDAYTALEYVDRGDRFAGKSNSSSWHSVTRSIPTHNSQDLPDNLFHELGLYRWAFMQMTWKSLASSDEQHHVEWYLRTCEVTYWVDRFLAWWDGVSELVVRPVHVDVVREEIEGQKRMSRAWERVQRETEEKFGKWGF